MEKLIIERIEKNKNLFTEEEVFKIRNNYKLSIKIYLLALLDQNGKK